MPLTNDIELNGVSYSVVPGAYKKGLRRALAVSKPAARRTGKAIFGPFDRGLLQATAEDDERGWDGLTVAPAFDGVGVEPFPNSTSFADAMTEIPSTTNRAYGVVAGDAAYVGIGRRIYKSVLLSNGTWAAFTQAADLGVGFTIQGLTYYQDNLLVMLGSTQDIRKYNTTTTAVSTWRAGEKGSKGVGYAGQLLYGYPTLGAQDWLALSGDKWNGGAVTHYRQLDAPIVNMASFGGQVVIATRKSLYFMGGQAYPGEADDAAITGDSSRAPEWRGDPQPLMTHGAFTEGDDFVFLESYRGKLYTWLGGRVVEFDSGAEAGQWIRMGPEGANCYGACVAGDWLVVSTASRYGANYELWGFDGAGWWLLAQRQSSRYLWPMALAGAGNRELLTFRDGGGTYDLFRLRWRSSSLHTYAAAGTWTSSLIDGGDPTKDKTWMRMGATFAAPSDRGNAASVDSVTFPVEYSTNGGVSWATASSTASAAAGTRVFVAEHEFLVPPQSRYLQLRVRWESVSDWAPVLTSLWAEYELSEEYVLNELAAAEYEAARAAEDLLRRRWELTLDAGDRGVRRDGQVNTLTGRQAITALWNAWELGTELDFKDIDNDTDPVMYLVQIVGMEEKAVKPSDAARWGESQVTLTLEESDTGLAAGVGGVHLHALDDLGDVTLTALDDQHMLAWDEATERWVNTPLLLFDNSMTDPLLAVGGPAVAGSTTISMDALLGRWTEFLFKLSGVGVWSFGADALGFYVWNPALSQYAIQADPATNKVTLLEGIVVGDGADNSKQVTLDLSAIATATLRTLGVPDLSGTLALVGTSQNHDTSGHLKSSGAGGVGYATGAGGTVTQLTSKATGVTLNKVTGQITTQNAALAAAAEVSFVVTNSTVEANDVVVVCIKSGATLPAHYQVTVGAVAAGSFTIAIANLHTASLSDTLVLNFVVLKGVAA